MAGPEPNEEPVDDGDAFDRIVAGLELSMPADLDDLKRIPEPEADVFEPRMSDPLTEADLDPDDHFVPPEPEPFPELDPLTRAAWATLLGSPVVLLVMIVLHITWPSWLASALVLGFVAALVFLLSRRGNHDRGDDPDQGAVI